jgi:hypothetical protein
MKVVNPCAARFENTKVLVHRRSRKRGRCVDGRYIRVGGIFRIGTPLLKPRQFMGIQTCLAVTMDYPDYVNGLLDVAADLPGLTEKRSMVWVGDISCSTSKGGLWYYVPRGVWGWKEGEDTEKVITADSYVTIVRGNGGGIYYVLKIPLITAKYLRSRYKKS